MPITYIDEIMELSKYKNDIEKSYGPVLLGFPDGANSTRLFMLASNLKQVIVQLDPDVPRVFTGYENIIGEHNKSYKKAKGSWEILDKIIKYENGPIYTLVLYNEDTDTYEMIEKKIAEDLTEKFGYLYNTEYLDNLNIGDKIANGDILWKSTSYDNDMNYRMGKNALVMYLTTPFNIEDAIPVRRSWAEKILVTEVDTASVNINPNDILLNIYGDKEEYKTFADIGENFDGTICALRRLNYSYMHYDFQESQISTINSTDTELMTSPNSRIYDINIYCNNEEGIPDSIFYKQLKKYYTQLCEYADKIYNWTVKIKESGSRYTRNVNNMQADYQYFNNPEYKWEMKDKVFDNLLVEFKTYSIHHLEAGYKLVGRYGDKGVISKLANTPLTRDSLLGKSILSACVDNPDDLSEEEVLDIFNRVDFVEDSEMPYLADGRIIDIVFNSSGPLRRLNIGQLEETEINFISERIRERLNTLESYDDKASLIFKYLSLLKNNQYDYMKNIYDARDDEGKKQFIDTICKNGFYIHKSPSSQMHYEMFKEIYKEFPWIEPYDVYINIFGLRKKMMRKCVVGEKYILVLKQTTTKNFSARSTGRLDKKLLPQKTADKKFNREAHSTTPIRIGEAYNMMSLISGMTIAEYSLFMRSSPAARRSLEKILASTDNPLLIDKLEVQLEYINFNAVILHSIFECMGIRLEFYTRDEIEKYNETVIEPFYINGILMFDYRINRKYYNALYDKKMEYLKSIIIVEAYPNQREDLAWEYVLSLEGVKDMPIYDNVKDFATFYQRMWEKKTNPKGNNNKLKYIIKEIDETADYKEKIIIPASHNKNSYKVIIE